MNNARYSRYRRGAVRHIPQQWVAHPLTGVLFPASECFIVDETEMPVSEQITLMAYEEIVNGECYYEDEDEESEADRFQTEAFASMDYDVIVKKYGKPLVNK